MEIRNMKALDFLRSFDDSSIDMVMTDPPYNVEMDYDSYDDNMEEEDYWVWIRDIFSEVARVLSSDGCFAVVTPYDRMRKWFELVDSCELNEVKGSPIIWARPNTLGYANNGWKPATYPIHFLAGDDWSPSGGDDIPKEADITNFNFVRATAPQSNFNKEERVHPAQQPRKVYRKMILKGCSERETVVDPFMGSGTTAVVCEKWNRDFIGCEIDEGYIEKAKNRLSDIGEPLD